MQTSRSVQRRQPSEGSEEEGSKEEGSEEEGSEESKEASRRKDEEDLSLERLEGKISCQLTQIG